MDLNNLFEQGKKGHGYRSDYRYRHDDHSLYAHSYDEDYIPKNLLLRKLMKNRKIKLLLIIIAIVLIAVVITGVVLLFPLLNTLLQFVSENGIQGLIDTIWKGSGA